MCYDFFLEENSLCFAPLENIAPPLEKACIVYDIGVREKYESIRQKLKVVNENAIKKTSVS